MLRNSIKIGSVVAVVIACSAWGLRAQAPAAAPAGPTVVRTVLNQQDLPMAGGYAAALVRVDLPVGAREGRHQHPGTLIAHVVEGVLTLDYEGKPTMEYKVGDTFFVEPMKIHEGMNKGTVPTKLIASFVFPKDKPMTIQVPAK
jgi:quercetin dioxygenase-like cupin family protein